MSDSRLYIATRDPRDGGGVGSMSRFVYATAEAAGYDPCLVFNMLDDESQIRLQNARQLVGFDAESSIEPLTIDGMETKGIPLVFPEIEVGHYLLNREAWEAAIADGDVLFAVGGTNQCAYPFVRTEQPFGCWVATLLWEDRVDRLESAPLIERVRDRLSRPLLERIEKRALEAATPSVVLSDYTARRVADQYAIPRSSLNVIPYPIDTKNFTPDSGEDDPSTSGPVALFVGRFNDPRKNIELLVEAFARVAKDLPDAKLWLIGAEPTNRLREVVSEAGIADRVVFKGRIPNNELAKYYRAADVFTIPSNQEGLAIVGLEAMACGTPIISTRCGGPEQYIQEGETGYLVPRGEADVLAEKLQQLLSDTARCSEMGEAARALITEKYAASKIREEFVDAFETVEQA